MFNLLSKNLFISLILFCFVSIKVVFAIDSVSDSKVLDTTVNKTNTQELMPVEVKVNVGHIRDARNYFVFYPYPIKPPVIKNPINLIPTDPSFLKMMLTTSGYTGRSAREIPYPSGGWRWRAIFNNALSKCPLGLPHTYFSMPQWREKMTPLVIDEINISNGVEIQRLERYKKLLDIYDDDNRKIEHKCAKIGLLPVKVQMIQLKHGYGRYGVAKLPAGTWWLVGTHKAPGITYYWQEPLKVKSREMLINENIDPSKPQVIELYENNAAIIDGAW